MKEVADIVAGEITGERGGEVHRRLPLPDVTPDCTNLPSVSTNHVAGSRRGTDTTSKIGDVSNRNKCCIRRNCEVQINTHLKSKQLGSSER